MSCIIIFLTIFESIVSFYLSHNFRSSQRIIWGSFYNFDLHQNCKIKVKNIRLWQQKNPHLLFFGQSVRKNRCRWLSTIKAKLHSYICFQNQHLIFHRIVNKSAQGEEANFGSSLLYCYTLVKLNKFVNPIDLQEYKPFLGVDRL